MSQRFTDHMTEFDQLLRFDGLGAAESVTGKSYKEDKATETLGLFLHMKNVEEKRAELTLRDDTHYSSSFADLLRIYGELGFEQIHSHQIENIDAENRDDQFICLWHPSGVLATAESYSWIAAHEKPTVNRATIIFNIDAELLWKIPMSGSIVDGITVGDLDVREGLRHYWAKLKGHGPFVRPWIKRPYLFLVDYAQSRQTPQGYPDSSEYLHKITESVIATFPESVRKDITPDAGS